MNRRDSHKTTTCPVGGCILAKLPSDIWLPHDAFFYINVGWDRWTFTWSIPTEDAGVLTCTLPDGEYVSRWSLLWNERRQGYVGIDRKLATRRVWNVAERFRTNDG